MFLIEYSKNKFINGENIDWLQIDKNGIVSFTLKFDIESSYFVHAEFSESFLNNAQAIDANETCLQNKYLEIKRI